MVRLEFPLSDNTPDELFRFQFLNGTIGVLRKQVQTLSGIIFQFLNGTIGVTCQYAIWPRKK